MTPIERLELLATALETMPEERKFYMGDWVEETKTKWNEKGVMLLPEQFCGTAVCAFGHACTMPEFRAEGLSVRAHILFSGYGGFAPAFEDKTGFEAAELFFGLTTDEAWELFDPERYFDSYRFNSDDSEDDDDSYVAEVMAITPLDVAGRIRDLVASKKKENRHERP